MRDIAYLRLRISTFVNVREFVNIRELSFMSVNSDTDHNHMRFLLWRVWQNIFLLSCLLRRQERNNLTHKHMLSLSLSLSLSPSLSLSHTHTHTQSKQRKQNTNCYKLFIVHFHQLFGLIKFLHSWANKFAE